MTTYFADKRLFRGGIEVRVCSGSPGEYFEMEQLGS